MRVVAIVSPKRQSQSYRFGGLICTAIFLESGIRGVCEFIVI